MRRPPRWILLTLLAACNAQISGAPIQHEVDAPPVTEIDAPPSTPPPDIDAPPPLGAWSTPQKIDVASSSALEDDGSLSSNTLELFFAISVTNGKDLYYATRASTTSAWTPAVPLSFNSASQSDETPRLSADDKTLYFASGRGGNGTLDIYKTTRPAAGSTAWTTPVALDSSVNTTTLNEKWFMLCNADHFLMVQDAGKNDTNLVEGFIGGAGATPATPLNSMAGETGTFVTPDCLSIYFASARGGKTHMYRSQRARVTDPWDAPSQVTDFESVGGNQEDPWISPDQRTFVFASDAAGSGNKDLYLSTR